MGIVTGGGGRRPLPGRRRGPGGRRSRIRLTLRRPLAEPARDRTPAEAYVAFCRFLSEIECGRTCSNFYSRPGGGSSSSPSVPSAGEATFGVLDRRGEWAWQRDHAARRPRSPETSRPSTSRRASPRFKRVERDPDGTVAMSRIAARTRPAIDPEEDSYATRRRRPDCPQAHRTAGAPTKPRRPLPGAVQHRPGRQAPARPGRLPLRHHAP